jgi:predicted  nucleic acid-binding Zn-ribbon protein
MNTKPKKQRVNRQKIINEQQATIDAQKREIETWRNNVARVNEEKDDLYSRWINSDIALSNANIKIRDLKEQIKYFEIELDRFGKENSELRTELSREIDERHKLNRQLNCSLNTVRSLIMQAGEGA